MYRQKPKKIALIEYERYHYETLPSIAAFCVALGYKVDVFTQRNSKFNNPFDGSKLQGVKRYDLDGLVFWFKKKRNLASYDAVIINTIEIESGTRRHDILNKISAFKIPILGVIHGAEILNKDKAFRTFFQAKNHTCIVLDNYIYEQYKNTCNMMWLNPIVGPDENKYIPKTPTPLKDPIRFAVQGYFDYTRKTYDELLDCIVHFSKQKRPFKVYFLGNTSNNDGQHFKQRITDLRLENYVVFFPKMLTFKELYSHFAQMHFVLTLLEPETKPHLASYIQDRHSGAFSLALQFNTIPITRREFENCYDWHPSMLKYEQGQLKHAFENALTLSASEYTALANQLQKNFIQKWKDSKQQLEQTLNRLLQ